MIDSISRANEAVIGKPAEKRPRLAAMSLLRRWVCAVVCSVVVLPLQASEIDCYRIVYDQSQTGSGSARVCGGESLVYVSPVLPYVVFAPTFSAAYILEPNTSGDYSDIVIYSAIERSNGWEFTITFLSDPIADSNIAFIASLDPAVAANTLTETTGPMDLTAALFHQVRQDRRPFTVLFESDPDSVPEPSQVLLVSTGLAGLFAIHRRRGRAHRRPSASSRS